MEKILDTMVWIAFFNENSPYHKEAIKLIDKYEREIIIPVNILAEIVNVLERDYEIPKDEMEEIIFLLTIKFRTENLYYEDFVRAFGIFKKYNITIFDALVISKAIGREFITFDRKLKEIWEKIKIH